MAKPIIFFSWTNHSGYRPYLTSAIREACDRLGYYYDETTQGEPGSPHIVDTLLSKIKNCTVFVCDLTPDKTEGSSKAPNPNVLFELGYATALHPHTSIIMLAKANTNIDNFPFDIRHRRVGSFPDPRIDLVKKASRSGKDEDQLKEATAKFSEWAEDLHKWLQQALPDHLSSIKKALKEIIGEAYPDHYENNSRSIDNISLNPSYTLLFPQFPTRVLHKLRRLCNEHSNICFLFYVDNNNTIGEPIVESCFVYFSPPQITRTTPAPTLPTGFKYPLNFREPHRAIVVNVESRSLDKYEFKVVAIPEDLSTFETVYSLNPFNVNESIKYDGAGVFIDLISLPTITKRILFVFDGPVSSANLIIRDAHSHSEILRHDYVGKDGKNYPVLELGELFKGVLGWQFHARDHGYPNFEQVHSQCFVRLFDAALGSSTLTSASSSSSS
eukprot:TRINITY_DN11987_c0_g1_i1.p1 TRINITY_DN11987_c0_g1~~TRINITY_DN11987_c0_g1_i1.p1  ORF type:complete len:449 (-),score=31.20 TRINITY_DN11987_c0_g1_i1:57-1382(-)